jgi:hypothetical protein
MDFSFNEAHGHLVYVHLSLLSIALPVLWLVAVAVLIVLIVKRTRR